MLNKIADALVRGDRVELRGFGVFSVRQYQARSALNPRTGAGVNVGPRRRPVFKVGRELRRRLNRTQEDTSGWIAAEE
jgi:integration host factor subunit beta